MIFGSLCSGIDAASVAWNPLGWRAAFFSEIDAFPSAVLAHHYPGVPNRGDMTGFKDWPDAALDLLCGGTPCQSFSNAGLRKGLDDPRGSLMLTFGAVAARHRPRWLVWENVPGVLSSGGGRDFGAFLGLLGFLGYGFAYRVLDAQFVRVDGHGRAVPQRRNRVFVVGCLGDWRSAAAVFLERESLRGDSAPSRSAGARVAATLTRGAESGGRGSYAGRRQEDDTNIVGALAGNGPGAGWRIGPDEAAAGQLVAHTLRGEGFDASEDGSQRGTPLVSLCLNAKGGAGRLDGESETLIPTNGGVFVPDVHPTLVARSSRGGGQTNSPGHNADETLIAFDTTQITSRENRCRPEPSDPRHPLAAHAHAHAHAPAIAFNARQDPINGPINGPIDTCGSSNGVLVSAARVRRLMPIECERLMRFPDGYTAIPFRGKPVAADGPRYKALGNSWAVNCARWIGWRIATVDSITSRRAA